LTNLDGAVVQHVEYVPFGEVFLEERNNVWNSSFLFNAKELDEETGLYYFSARYFDPRVSVWLSVDPKLEKYPSWSPYAYALQNPVKLIDPDGKDIIIVTDWDGALGNGHAAVIIGSEKTGWKYVSMNGTGERAKIIGKSKNPDLGDIDKEGKKGQNRWKAGTPLEEVLKAIQDTNPKAKHDYTSYTRIETTKEEDDIAYTEAKKQASAKIYSIFGSSCIDVPQEALKAVVTNRMGESEMPEYEQYMWGFDDMGPNVWHAKLRYYIGKMNESGKLNVPLKARGAGETPITQGGAEREKKDKAKGKPIKF
jgi:RHS repeat-associated protein